MKYRLNNFSFKRVRKNEVPEIMLSILDIVDKHDPKAKLIVGMYNLLLELKPQLNILAVTYIGYPNPKELVNQLKVRNQLLGAIIAQINAIEKANMADTAAQADLATPFLKLYLKGISSNSSSVKTGKIERLLSNLQDNTIINDALTTLGFTAYIDGLRVSQEIINAGMDEHREALSTRARFNTIAARSKVESAIINLLNAINLAQVEHADIDYDPMIDELNVLLNSKMTIIKSRITTNRNKLEALKTTTVDSSTTTTSTAI